MSPVNILPVTFKYCAMQCNHTVQCRSALHQAGHQKHKKIREIKNTKIHQKKICFITDQNQQSALQLEVFFNLLMWLFHDGADRQTLKHTDGHHGQQTDSAQGPIQCKSCIRETLTLSATEYRSTHTFFSFPLLMPSPGNGKSHSQRPTSNNSPSSTVGWFKIQNRMLQKCPQQNKPPFYENCVITG